MKLPVWLLSVLLLSSCGSPPKPPGVDPAKKHPVNAAIAVDLQTCQGDLRNTRILADEKTHDAETTRQAFARVASAPNSTTRATQPGEVRSAVYAIRFPFGGTTVALAPAQAERLLHEARDAPLVVLSGRTDGASDSLAEGRIAKHRAEAVYAYLVAAGIAPTRIRTTWQPVGDHAADNTSEDGRALNRRVEIEIYRAAPRSVDLDGGAAA